MSKLDDTVKVRDAEYGGFETVADIAQTMKDKARETPGWRRMNPVQREAMDMVLHKSARLLSGNPNNFDGWHDIQGYAKLAEDRLPKVISPWDAPGQIVTILDAPESRWIVVGHHDNTSFLKSMQTLGQPYIFIQRSQLQIAEAEEDWEGRN